MANQVFNQLGGRHGGMNQIEAFKSFMGQHKGQDPDAMIQQLVSSGRISQAQLDQVQRVAGQMGGMFDGLKSAFGF